MLIDARRGDQTRELVHDLIIVGSGFAGLAIADRLRGAGISVCVLESGGWHPELRTQRLYRAENVGEEYFALDACRYRLFGGSSNRWGGWCRPLDPIDFQARDWIPESGWPIGYDDLVPYFAATADLLELPTARFDADQWSHRLSVGRSLSGGDMEDIIVQFSPEVNVAEVCGPRVLAASNITTMLHANVTGFVMEPGTQRVAGAVVQAIGHRPFTVRGKAVVLATGGIENARLLLGSRSDRGAGLGNEFDLVGRYFMEHLHVPGGYIAGLPAVPPIYRRVTDNWSCTRGLLSPRAEALSRRRLPSCSIGIEPAGFSVLGTPFLGWSPLLTTLPVSAYRRLRGVHRDAADRLRWIAEVQWRQMRILQTSQRERRSRSGTGRSTAGAEAPMLSTYIRAEQTPNAHSRVTLDDRRRDALGVPQSRLDWRVSDADWLAVDSWLGHLGAGFEGRGTGERYVPAEIRRDEVIGGPHHMGTTRMSAVPSRGVVDADCRVHTVDNLFVAGSSVFTTGGWANPTFTIVALALRLADHLQAQLSGAITVTTTATVPPTPSSPAARPVTTAPH